MLVRDSETNNENFLEDGTWHHLAVVVDGVNNSIYLDGVSKEVTFKVGSTTTSNAFLNTNSNTLLRIGDSTYSGGHIPFEGLIDEVKIYNYGLTADEVLIDMNQGSSSVMGNLGTDSSGNPDSSIDRSYCVPGDTSTCNSPIAEWRFDEKTGSSVYDTSENNYTGTIGNATWVSGKKGSALSFDADSDYVDFNTGPKPTTGITIEAWVKPTAVGGGVLHNVIDHHLGYEFQERGDSNWRTYINLSTSSWQTAVCSSITVQPNQWYFVSGTYDSAAGVIKTYVDGINCATASGFGGQTIAYGSTDETFIGALNNGTDREFQGIIDDVRIYDYARSQEQISWSMNRGAPIGWWKFDECEGSTVYDWAPSGDGYRGNDATINIGGTGSQTTAGTCETSGTAWYNGSTGYRNSSLNFDGTDDYVQVMADGSSSYNFQEYSITAWFKSSVDPDTAAQTIWSYDYTSHAGAYYAQNLRLGGASGTDDEIFFGWNNAASANGINVGGALTGTQTDWHHITATYKSGEQILYLDGKAVGSDNKTGNITYYSQEVWIGKGNFSSPFNGLIDDVRIYNYTLTPEQVNSVMNDGAVSF